MHGTVLGLSCFYCFKPFIFQSLMFSKVPYHACAYALHEFHISQVVLVATSIYYSVINKCTNLGQSLELMFLGY